MKWDMVEHLDFIWALTTVTTLVDPTKAEMMKSISLKSISLMKHWKKMRYNLLEYEKKLEILECLDGD